jgi:hypothetical protein
LLATETCWIKVHISGFNALSPAEKKESVEWTVCCLPAFIHGTRYESQG